MTENLAKLVTALRSGEYEQGRHALRVGDKFCCLGVACDLYAKETGLGHWEETEVLAGYQFVTPGDSITDILPVEVMNWLGLPNKNGTFRTSSGGDQALSELNDRGIPFSLIADKIESNPKWIVRSRDALPGTPESAPGPAGPTE